MTGIAVQQPLTTAAHRTRIWALAVLALIAVAVVAGAFYVGRVTASPNSPTLGGVTVNAPSTDSSVLCQPHRPC